jgi:hypothetical protein
VLAGLVTAMGKRNRPIELAEVDRVWELQDVVLPENEKIKAVRSLVARDVIVGDNKYQFAIELQRLWIHKYAKLDWVKEEITPTVERWQLPPEKTVERLQLRRSKTDLAALASILGVFAALIIVLFQGVRSTNDSVVSERTQRQTSEAQLAGLVAAQATGTFSAMAAGATATADAAQLRTLQLTAAAAASDCALPESATDDLVNRLNTLQDENGVAAVLRNNRLSLLAWQSGNKQVSGAAQPENYDSVIFQGCHMDDLWLGLSNDPTARQVLLSPAYVAVGIGLHSGNLNTLVLKFATPEPAPTLTPRPTDTPTPMPTATALFIGGPLTVNWSIESEGQNLSNPNQWRRVIKLKAQGGSGRYQYFHDGLPIANSRVEIVYNTCIAKPGSFWVQDSAGKLVKKNYYLFSPYCPNITPQP